MADWYRELRARRALEGAARKLDAGDLDGAERTLERAVGFARGRSELEASARWQRAEVLAKLGLFSESADELRALISLRSGEPELLRTLALRLEKARRTDAAIETWGELLALKPDDHDAHDRLAGLFQSAGRKVEAVSHVHWLAEASHLNVAAWKRLATLRVELGELNASADAWSQVAQQDPTAREQAIELLDALGRGEEAIRHIRAAAEASVGQSKPWNRLARRLIARGDLQEAIEILLRIAEHDLSFHETLAQLFIDLGRPQDATTHIRTLAEAKPQKVKGWARLARHLSAAGAPGEAAGVWRRVLDLKPEDQDAQDQLRNALDVMQPRAEAVPHYQALLALRPFDIGIGKALAAALQEARDYEAAVAAWRTVIERAPQDLEGRERLAVLLIGLKRQSQAIPHLRAHAEAEPGRAKLWRRLATTLQALGQAAEAAEVWTTVLELEPSDLDGRTRLVELLRSLGPKASLAVHVRALAETTDAPAELWRELARLLDELDGAPEERIDVWRKVLDVAPEDLEAHGRSGALLWESGLRRAAIPHLEAISRTEPQRAKIWKRLALSRQELHDIDGEIEALGQAVRLDPTDRQGRQRLSTLLWEVGRHREAVPYLRASFSEGGLGPKELKRLARTIHQTGDEEGEQAASLSGIGEVFEEIALWKQVLGGAPDDLEAHNRLAELFWERSRKKEAAPHLRIAAEAAPRQSKLWRRLAACLEETDEIGAAMAALAHLAALEGAKGPAKRRLEQLRARGLRSPSNGVDASALDQRELIEDL